MTGERRRVAKEEELSDLPVDGQDKRVRRLTLMDDARGSIERMFLRFDNFMPPEKAIEFLRRESAHLADVANDIDRNEKGLMG